MKKKNRRGSMAGSLCAVLAVASLIAFVWSGFHMRFLVTFMLCALSAVLNFTRP